jgi:chitin disaccharide deacetylase
MQTIILCADDFAMTPGISKGICELLKKKRLSATSCMTISPLWSEYSTWLKPFKEHADIGLHLTLTDFPSLSNLSFTDSKGRLPPFKKLFKLAYGNRLNNKEITMEFQSQFEAFQKEFGSMPDFIDGHQHIHQLPVIRKSVIELFKNNFQKGDGYLRICWENPLLVWKRNVNILRTLIIGFPGLKMRKLARKEGIPFNDGFSGIYSLSLNKNISALFSCFLIGVREKSLIICHPGKIDFGSTPEINLTKTREAEYRFLDSLAFQSILDQKQMRLGRFKECK